MKDILKSKYFVITTIIVLLAGIGLPFLINFILFSCGIYNFQYPLIVAIFAFLYALIASLIGDLSVYIYKKKNDLIVSDAPQEIKDKAKLKKYPFVIGCIACVIVFGILFIVYKTTGKWPLL